MARILWFLENRVIDFAHIFYFALFMGLWELCAIYTLFNEGEIQRSVRKNKGNRCLIYWVSVISSFKGGSEDAERGESFCFAVSCLVRIWCFVIERNHYSGSEGLSASGRKNTALARPRNLHRPRHLVRSLVFFFLFVSQFSHLANMNTRPGELLVRDGVTLSFRPCCEIMMSR